MKHKTYTFYIALILFTVFSCGKKQETEEKESGLVEITKAQFDSEGMHLSQMQTTPFESMVKCSGSIISKPNGMAVVNAPLAGVVKRILCQNGQYVAKNQTLMEISGAEVIDLQRELAESAAMLKRTRSEYERVKLLYAEKVAPEKEFITSESEYRTSNARYNGLKLKAQALGFSVGRIENGSFQQTYAIRSPISGYISNLKATIGAFVDMQTSLIEISDPQISELQLSVFTADIRKIQKGQSVRFRFLGSDNTRLAVIKSVGVTVNNDSKSINCYATISNIGGSIPISNTAVEADIITGTDHVNTLPSEAIIKTETTHYILVLEKKTKDKYYFKKVQVQPGRQQNGLTEITGEKINGEIVTNGIYNIAL